MWFLQIVRSFFYVIDNTLYNFIPTVYDLLMTISRTSILTQSQIKEFADRIQMLLGVFMLFKVSFSLITYIINPDEFSDKSKGFGKLWMNAVLSLLMLVFVPYAFNMAYELQAMVLKDNAIGTLILGEKPDNNYLNNTGQSIAYHVMIPFFSPGNFTTDLSSCVNLLDEQGNFNEECSQALYSASGITPVPNHLIEDYKKGVEAGNIGLTFRLDIAKQTATSSEDGASKEYFLIHYMAPISTVVAVIVLLLLVTFCMDVALRSVKLAFLQLIAPIPIISFIDPKSGKDGIFKKWYQMCFSTYASLFVRLAALYFGIYIIAKVNGMYDVINGSTVSDPWIQIFVIIGVLMFVKQLPKILEGFGIKLDGGGFTLNPFKKFQEQAFGGKQIIGAGAAGLAGLAAGGTNLLGTGNKIASNWRDAQGKGFLAHAKAVGKGLGSGVLSTAGGLIGGTRRGLLGAARGERFGQVYSRSYGGAMKARYDREDRKADDVKWYESAGASVQKTLGMHTKADVAKKVNDDFKAFQGSYDNIKNIATANDDKAKTLKRQLDELNKTTINTSDYMKYNMRTSKFELDTDEYQKAIDKLNVAKKKVSDDLDDRINELAAGSDHVVDSHGVIQQGAEAAIKDAMKSMEVIQERINRNASSIDKDFVNISGADVTSRYKSSLGAQSQFSNSAEASHAQTVDQYARPLGPAPERRGGRGPGGPGGHP